MSDDPIEDVPEFIRQKLAEFAKTQQTGIVTFDVTLSWGQPTGVNVTNKENRKVRIKEKRERFPTK